MCLYRRLVRMRGYDAHAEDSNKEETPKGKAIITIFSDIHSGFGHVNDDRGF